jgi:hypothetical protein
MQIATRGGADQRSAAMVAGAMAALTAGEALDAEEAALLVAPAAEAITFYSSNPE